MNLVFIISLYTNKLKPWFRHELLNSGIWTGNKAKITAIADQHEAQRKENTKATAVDKAQYDQSRVRNQWQQLHRLMYGKLQQ